jgi:hypothetical protein
MRQGLQVLVTAHTLGHFECSITHARDGKDNLTVLTQRHVLTGLAEFLHFYSQGQYIEWEPVPELGAVICLLAHALGTFN